MANSAFDATSDAFSRLAGDEEAVLRRLDMLAKFLDSAFEIPILRTRVGADALLNLVPGAGIVLAKGLSAYLIFEAHRLGAPRLVLLRMIGNLGLDFAISLVPVAGWVGDVFFRANLRNMAILREHLAARRASGVGGQKPGIVIDGEAVRGPAG